jgi:hypothetical protein
VVSYHGEDVARVIDGVMETRGEGGRGGIGD